MSFAENLKILISTRDDLKSPSDFARKVGLSRQAVNSMIRGKVECPSPASLEKLIAYFNCTESDLIDPCTTRVDKVLSDLMFNDDINIKFALKT